LRLRRPVLRQSLGRCPGLHPLQVQLHRRV